MRKVKVGGESLSPVGLGCMGLGGAFAADREGDREALASLRIGIGLGMTFIDTAEGYAGGHSEELVGEAVAGIRKEVFLATKVSPEHLDAGSLVRSCEATLRRLRTDCVDLYQIHWPNPSVPLEETLAGLVSLREQGKIRHIGLSNFRFQEVVRAAALLGPVPLFSIQTEYNLFERAPEKELIPWCSRHGAAFIAYSPLDQGRLVGNRAARNRLKDLAREAGCTPAQLALAFLGSRGPVVSIPKALRADHIRENGGALGLDLPAGILDRVDVECRIPVVHVDWQTVRPVQDRSGGPAVYGTLEEARENPAGHTPSPMELAEEIREDDRIKPIRVIPSSTDTGRYRYDLAEGRIRFWAWVLAFNGERDVPVMIRD